MASFSFASSTTSSPVFALGVIVTTAHDELAFHFGIVKRMLNTVPHIVTLNPEESKLVCSKLSSGHEKVKLAGLGIDIPDKISIGQSVGIEKNVLYLGRISAGKGVVTLIQWMEKNFPNIRLRLAGKIESDMTLPISKQIDNRGFVSEEEKGKLIDEASVVVNPSAHESLSLIVLEAMARKRPVLVNGNCSVLEHYAKETTTVFSFENEDQFIAAMNIVLSTDWDVDSKVNDLENSSEWVRRHYSWPAVFRVYENTLK